MSKLAKDMAKAGLDPLKSKTETKKSSLAALSASPGVMAAVDSYLSAESDLVAAELQLKTASKEIVNFAIDTAIRTKSMTNVEIAGSKGAVGVIFKDQYSLKDKSQLDSVLKAHNLNPDDFIKEKTTINFAYDVLTDEEKTKLFKFLSEELGKDRMGQIVTESTKYEIKGLKDRLAVIAKNREDFDNLKEVSGMYTPTVAKRKA